MPFHHTHIWDSVGNTPLLFLFEAKHGAKVFAKAEHLNPTGSVKDRAVKAMILDGLNTGKLVKGKQILDATSGNTGIAYAAFGASLGYKVVLCMPANANSERKRILGALGAEIVKTNPLESSDGALMKARELAAANPDMYFYPDQYNNDENWKAHYNGTAVEIWEQTEHKITHFVAGMGTSGTFTGTARRLKEFHPAIKTIPMQPASPLHGLEGMKDMETTIKPGFYAPELFDGMVKVVTDDARDTANFLAKKGLFTGISTGGNVRAAKLVADSLPGDAVVVTILCDNGYRYLNDELWEGYQYTNPDLWDGYGI